MALSKIKISGKGKNKRYYFEGKRIPQKIYKEIKSEPLSIKNNILKLRNDTSQKKTFDTNFQKVFENEKNKYAEKRDLRNTIKQAREEAKEGANYQPYFRAKETAENFFDAIGIGSRFVLKYQNKNLEFTFDEYFNLLDELIKEQRLENDKTIDDSPPVVLIFEDFEKKILYIDWTMISADNITDYNF